MSRVSHVVASVVRIRHRACVIYFVNSLLFFLSLFFLFYFPAFTVCRSGSLIIRQFCVLLNGERIYRAFARLLQTHEVPF